MEFLLILFCTTAAVWALRNPIKRYPMVFYVLALALNALLFVSNIMPLPRFLFPVSYVLMRRGWLGTALFVVVMFIGVFPRNGRVSKWLRPIRAELSIIASLLVAGHSLVYLIVYLDKLLQGMLGKVSVIVGFVVAMVLLVLLLVLGITSARWVKKMMKVHSWRRLQSLAYLFYALMFVHLALLIGPSALAGNTTSILSMVAYIAVFSIYVVTRIMRAIADRRDKVDLDATVREQGFGPA